MVRRRLTKNNKTMLIGLACGIACAICVGLYIVEVDAQASAAQAEILSKYGGEQVDVCVAKNDIVAGSTITEHDVETKTWIATLLPSNSVTNVKEIVGKHVGSTILAGEVITQNRLGFAFTELTVPDGMVALSVPTREVQAVGGSLCAGMNTDIYAVGSTSTTLLASSVPILATSLSSESASSASAWVTIALDPESVEEFVSAAENLELYFALPSDSVEERD